MTSTPTLPRSEGDPEADPEADSAAEPPARGVRRTGLSVPSAWVRARRRPDLEDPVVGWSASLGIAVLALFLRLWHLGQPKVFEFDETYYAKDAWSLLHFGYAQDYNNTNDYANKQILAGHTTGNWTGKPSLVVHPEVGKWLIALGEKTFGMDPFGWRISAAVVGSLMVLVMCRLARRMTGSTLLGLVAGLLLSLDGLQFVLSRLALLDIFLAFFMLCGVTCVVIDRDWYRAKMARLQTDQVTDHASWGPVRSLLFRPWLLLGGVCWGLAVGTKWDALFPLAAFGVMCWLWSAGARRSFGVRWSLARALVADAVPAFLYLVVLAGIVYTATWTGWLLHAHAYEKNLSSTQYTQFVREGPCVGSDPQHLSPQNVEDPNKRWPTATEPDAHGVGELWQSLRSLAYYHRDVYEFHTHFLNCSYHSYASKPSAWPLLNRPVGVAYTSYQRGDNGCDAPEGSQGCLRQVLLLGTPTIWWGGVLALLYAAAMWVGGRDWRFGVAVVGFLSTWLPWLNYDDRPIFIFYAVAMLPFTVLALTLAIGKLIGRSKVPSARRTVGVVIAGSFVVLTVLNFAWFWPIYTNGLLTHGEWLDRIWFQRWI